MLVSFLGLRIFRVLKTKKVDFVCVCVYYNGLGFTVSCFGCICQVAIIQIRGFFVYFRNLCQYSDLSIVHFIVKTDGR